MYYNHNKHRLGLACFTLALFLFTHTFTSSALAQDKDRLGKAISLYQHENYEEALQLLKELKSENPSSSSIAYYLGLTYKKLQDPMQARTSLEEALSLQPPVKNAIPELIDILYQTNEIEGAKALIERAETESVAPAQTAFMKGLVLLKEKKDIDGAIDSFDKAQKLDPSFAETAKYYKAMAYLQNEDIKKAKDVFKEIYVKDPTADLAAYANEYVEAINRKEKADKIFRGNVGFAMQYDDNVILKPNDQSLAAGVGNEGDWRTASTFQAEFNIKATDRFRLKSGYSLYYGKEFDLGFYDTLSNDLSLFPAIYLDKAMIGFPIHYNQVRINDKRYLDLVGVGNFNNIMLDRDNMLQAGFQHNRKYYNWPAARADDDRDSREYACSLGWLYFFTKDREGFVFARYSINYEDTKGNNWTYLGNRMSLGSTMPLSKRLRWSFAGEFYRQDFVKINSTYQKERDDNILSVSNMLALKVFKDCEIQLQHIFVDDAASIGVFKYDRNVYSAGVKYEF